MKHSSNFGLPAAFFKACLEGRFGATSSQNLVFYNVFEHFQCRFVSKTLVFTAFCGGRPLPPEGLRRQQKSQILVLLCSFFGLTLSLHLVLKDSRTIDPQNEQIRTRIWILGCLIFERLAPIGPPRFESRGGVGEG